MPARIAHLHPRRGLLRHLLRLPLWLYRVRLGGLLGGRILLMTHTGWTSGRQYRTPLEVVGRDQATGTYIVAAGWGERAGWYRNLQHTPEAEIAVGRRRSAVRAERLPVEEAERALHDHARRHPHTFRFLADLLLERRTERRLEDARILARTLPLVAPRPRQANA